MPYIDGFVLAVPNDNKEAYRTLAETASTVFKAHGATRVVEGWGDDVPEGELTSFTMAVKRQDKESIVFSWIEWPDKATRDSGMKKAMEDERMQCDMNKMPFDAKRMIFGGFNVLVSA